MTTAFRSNGKPDHSIQNSYIRNKGSASSNQVESTKKRRRMQPMNVTEALENMFVKLNGCYFKKRMLPTTAA
jgi:hypothetical protein